MKATLEPDHPNLLNCMSNLAIDYANAGRIAESIALQEEALRLKTQNPGPEHPDTLRTKDSLATTMHRAGRAKEAMSLQEETVKLARLKMPPDHPHVALFLSNLGEMYSAAGRFGDAALLHEEALGIARAKLGPEHLDTLAYLTRLAGAYLGAGRWIDAETASGACLNIRTAKHPDDWLRFQAMSQQGAALAGQKKYPAAEPFLIGGYEGMKRTRPRFPGGRRRKLPRRRSESSRSTRPGASPRRRPSGVPSWLCRLRAGAQSVGALFPVQRRSILRKSSRAQVECPRSRSTAGSALAPLMRKEVRAGGTARRKGAVATNPRPGRGGGCRAHGGHRRGAGPDGRPRRRRPGEPRLCAKQGECLHCGRYERGCRALAAGRRFGRPVARDRRIECRSRGPRHPRSVAVAEAAGRGDRGRTSLAAEGRRWVSPRKLRDAGRRLAAIRAVHAAGDPRASARRWHPDQGGPGGGARPVADRRQTHGDFCCFRRDPAATRR